MVNAIEVSPHDAGHRLRDHLEVQVQRLHAARLQDHRLRQDLDAHRRRHRRPRRGRASCARIRCARTCSTSAPRRASTSRSTAAAVDAVPAEPADHARSPISRCTAATWSRRRPAARSGSSTTCRRCGSGPTRRRRPTCGSSRRAQAYRTQAFGGGGSAAPTRVPAANPPERRDHRLLAGEGARGRCRRSRCSTAAGTVVRTLQHAASPTPTRRRRSTPPPTALTVKAGLNRLVWNVRHDQVVPVPGLFVFGIAAGPPGAARRLSGAAHGRRQDADRSRSPCAMDPRVDDAADRAAGAGRPRRRASTTS